MISDDASTHVAPSEAPPWSAAILAGGRARRLGGIPKGLLRVGGEPVVVRLLRLFTPRASGVLLVTIDTRSYSPLATASTVQRSVRQSAAPDVGARLESTPRVRLVSDVIPDKGAPGGVHAALAHAPEGWVFVAACDLPGLDASVIDGLAPHLADQDAVLWRAAGRLQPLAGFWHTRAAAAIERHLRAASPGFAALTAGLNVTVVDTPDERPFANLNTPEDLAAFGIDASDLGMGPAGDARE